MRDRYDLTDSVPPANGRAASARDESVAAVADPLEAGARVQVTVNRRVDVLELERSQQHISNPAYLAGRTIQALFERARGSRGSSAGPWRDGGSADAWSHDQKLVHAITDAKTLERYLAHMRAELGRMDTAIILDMLGDGHTYEVVALRRLQRSGVRARGYVATRFRDSLEAISLHIADWDR